MFGVELLIVHALATIAMTGIIWFVQVVHYPLFGVVGLSEFPVYEKRHTRQTGWIVAPLMLVELLTGILLLISTPKGIPIVLTWIGFALIGLIWVSTGLLQVPCHRRLGSSFCSVTHRRLVRSNWLRTAAWSLRAVIVSLMIGLAKTQVV